MRRALLLVVLVGCEPLPSDEPASAQPLKEVAAHEVPDTTPPHAVGPALPFAIPTEQTARIVVVTDELLLDDPTLTDRPIGAAALVFEVAARDPAARRWLFEAPVAAEHVGEHPIDVQLVDLAGNATDTALLQVTVDNTPPEVEFTANLDDVNGTFTLDSTFTESVTAVAILRPSPDEGPREALAASSTSDGHVLFTRTFESEPAAEYVVEVTATNNAGLTSVTPLMSFSLPRP